ncbi:alpha-glucan family phosphorylase [Paenibacillus chondroitinus]|uniref:Alpha-glucan family phosphorylase n=1 Tax=Paenibacillus chondroitinus TaxID=59842 RepID=A0ABU6D608_9BACL|nr:MULTISPECIES: alpha-glucan family phosphorylase [Paenibacillus]MCY9660809.1 alpha-glucan family phosphorylase [Paenibacillus anseongense]MEB4792393.1 alpha-glucan family phosphorylase [Paenibacillus chondroitinus]
MQNSVLRVAKTLPTAIERLSELAINLWFSWNYDALQLFAQMDPVKWAQSGHNPVRLLYELDDAKLDELSHNAEFLNRYRQVIDRFDAYLNGPTWFQKKHGDRGYVKVAYFSAEFGFHESLPIYSGGLGILAGDHAKSASDLGIPLVGVGLLYKKGYFTQKIDASGGQQSHLYDYDFAKLPIAPVLHQGSPLTVSIDMPGRAITLQIWQVQVGRNRIYLLDADHAANQHADKELTAQLYGGNQDTRIAQEIVLGIGGVKALRALGIYPNVYHINEGHAAFLTLERLKDLLHLGLPFHVAVETVRSATVFTTHTPVPAGHDTFSIGMVEHYLGPLFSELSRHKQAIIALGLDHHTGQFNMTHLAMNTAGLRNGVSKLHGQVSREMFKEFHGHIDASEVPIGSITNGVHLETWTASSWKELLDRFLPGTWREEQANKHQWQQVEVIPDESIWKVHQQLKDDLVSFARQNLMEQRRRNGESEQRIEEVRHYLNPKALTIGFARRFATYKRANLIFNDLYRLKKLINDPERPVQFIFAGKAHPADYPGQELIREIYRVSKMKEFEGKVVMLENYDINMARYLVQGVDVWLNNPRRPLEASGTSGQKAAMNGVLNFSVLDGWWEEGYNGTNGWAIGSTGTADWAVQEKENTQSIYHILEKEIIPLYYNQGSLPHQWISRMKRSIQSLSPIYNTHRMVQDYTEETYLPTADRARLFVANHYEVATKVADYKLFIRNNWYQVKIIGIDDRSAKLSTEVPLSEIKPTTKEVSAQIYFGSIWPQDTAVEIIYYEDNGEKWEQRIIPMESSGELIEHVQSYKASIPGHLVHGPHFSIRVRPISTNFAHSFELSLVTSTLSWQ